MVGQHGNSVRSKGEKSKLGKSQGTENRAGKYSEKQQRASPHRSPRSLFGGCCPPPRSQNCRHETRSHLRGKRRFLTHHSQQILQPVTGQKATRWGFAFACYLGGAPTRGALRLAPCFTQTFTFPVSCRGASELHFLRRWTLFDGF